MKSKLRDLELKSNGVSDCFVDLRADIPNPAVETSLCGNGMEEPGEQCDCGSDNEACQHEHCYPAHVSAWDRKKAGPAIFATIFFPVASAEGARQV